MAVTLASRFASRHYFLVICLVAWVLCVSPRPVVGSGRAQPFDWRPCERCGAGNGRIIQKKIHEDPIREAGSVEKRTEKPISNQDRDHGVPKLPCQGKTHRLAHFHRRRRRRQARRHQSGRRHSKLLRKSPRGGGGGQKASAQGFLRNQRSIDEQEPPQPIHEATTPEWVTSPTLKSDDDGSLGGLNHIPGFSSSEEKLLDYNYDSSSSLEGLLVAEAGEYEDEEEGDDDDEVNLANEETDLGEEAEGAKRQRKSRPRLDIVTKLLRIVESQALQGANCTPGTDLNLGDKVVNRYAQERFDQAAHVAVNRANWLTRMWKYAPEVIGHSEYLLHTSIISMVEFNEDIFAAGNCYDAEEYKNYFLFCPYAHRLLDGPILAKDLAIEYKYLSNTSEWFFIARKEAEKVIEMGRSMKIGYHTYTYNATSHTHRETDMILTVAYEDGAWSKPYYDCGGGNIWMMTYTVPFFGFENGKYFFKGTSGIDIDLRRVDINQCKGTGGTGTLNIFGGTDKCKTESTMCTPIAGLGFRRGSYKCVCQIGYYFPDTKSPNKYFNGTALEEEYAKILEGQKSIYEDEDAFQCLKCAPGCEECVDNSPCIVTLNWVLRTILLILQCIIIGCLPIVVLFTYKYKDIKVVRAASPLLLRIIILGAFFIYTTTIVLYPVPNIVTCTMRIWLREIGFALSYGALMLKTWRISVIFRVRSAKAVKITDMDLIKRLGIIVGIFVLCLLIRTLVSPPVVIVGRTAENLKAFLCQSDWWDHSFTILEFLFLLWGIRLCIMVRKAPSEFNESRFISMTIYNEFLLSIFLNVSMFFLQHPANPDLLYIIFFCHSQLTITILLCLIFASKFYLVVKGHGKADESLVSKNGPGKFVASKMRAAHASLSQQSNPTMGQVSSLCTDAKLSEKDIQTELDKIFQTLNILKDKNPTGVSNAVAVRISAIQEAFKESAATGRSVPGGTNEGLRHRGAPQGDGKLVSGLGGSLALPNGQLQVRSSNNSTLSGIGGALVVAETAALAAATMSSSHPPGLPETVIEEPEETSPLREEAESPVPTQTRLDETEAFITASTEDEPAVERISTPPGDLRLEGSPTPSQHRRPSSCMSSCRSSQCCTSSDCSYCNQSQPCSIASPGKGVPSSCSMGSECIFHMQQRDGMPPRKRSMNIQTDLVNSPVFMDHDRAILSAQEDDEDSLTETGETLEVSDEIPLTQMRLPCQEHSSLRAARPASPAAVASVGDTSFPNSGAESSSCSLAPSSRVRASGPPPPIPRRTSGGLKMVPNHDTRSGHERTHRIIINLDDKNRFTDEVTV